MWRKWVGVILFVGAVSVVGYFILPEHSQRGKQFVDDKEYGKAIDQYERALAAREDENATNILQQLAYLYLWEGNKKKHVEMLTRLDRALPDQVDVLKQLANAYQWTPTEEDRQKAITVYERIVKLAEDDADAWETLAEYYEWHKRYPDSIRAYQKLKDIRPEKYRYWEHLANLYKWTDNPNAAIDVYQDMLVRFADRPELIKKHLGKAYAAVAKGPEAARYLEEYLAVRPRDRRMRELIVNLYDGQNLKLKAIRHREYLAANHPQVPRYRDELVKAYGLAFQYEPLIRLLQEDLVTSPDDPGLLLTLANAYVDAGHVDKALHLLQASIDSGKATPQITDLAKELNRQIEDMKGVEKVLLAQLKANRRDVDALRELAELKRKSKDMDAAAAYYERLLRVDASHEDAHRALVDIYTRRQKLPEAIPHGKYLLERHGKDRALLQQMANLYAWTGNPRAAAEVYARLVDLEPNDPIRRDRMAEILSKLGRHAKAAEHLEAAVKLKPGHLPYRQELADAYARAGYKAKRIKTLEAIVDKFPDEPAHRIALAGALGQAGRYPDAIRVYRSLLEHDPDSVNLSMLLADAYENNHQLAQAIRIHQRLLEKHPADTGLLNTIGLRYMALADRENARKYFGMTLALDPNNQLAIKKMGTIAAWNNDLVHARYYYQKFIALGGRDYEVHFLLGELYYDANLPARAYAEHEKALELLALAPIDLGRRLTIARIHFRRGKLLESIRMHRQLTLENPADPGVWEDYLETLVLAKQYGLAEAVSARITKEFPRSRRGPRLRARVYLETGRFEQAAMHLRNLLDRWPNDSALKVDLARAYMETGMMPKALPLLQQAIHSGTDVTDEVRIIRDLYATTLATRFSFLNAPDTVRRSKSVTTFRYWLNDRTRFTGVLDVTQYRQNRRELTRKINDVIVGKFARVDYDFTPRVRGYVGFGLETDASQEQASYLAGAVWRPMPEVRAEASYSGRRLATWPLEFLNVDGVVDRTQVDASARVWDRWRFGGGWTLSQFYIDSSENVIDRSSNFGRRNELYGEAEYILLEGDHYLSTTYRFQYSQFDLERGDLDELVPILIKERAHIGSVRWEHRHTRRWFHGASLFAGYDPARVQPVIGVDGETRYRFSERLKAVLRGQYLAESNRAGGGSEYEMTFGLEWSF